MSDRDKSMTWIWTLLGAALALLTSLGSIYLSVGLGLAACPLCYYQRTFAFATFAVLILGVIFRLSDHVCLPALALPLALAGVGVAALHVSFELRGKMECPIGVTGILSAPKESLTSLGVLSLVLLAGALSSKLPGSGPMSVIMSVVLAGLFTAGGMWSVSLPPAPKAAAYKLKLTTCRPLPPPAEE